MGKRSAAVRAAGWVAVGAVAAGGVGVASAASDSGGSGSVKPGTVTTAAETTPAAPAAGKKAQHRRALLARLHGRLLHAQATVVGKDGKPMVVAEQRGTVAAVSPTSITLASSDGFKQTYVVTADTKVRVDGKKSEISAVKTGDTAGVVAKVSGSTQTAYAVVERPAKTAPKS